MKGKVWNELKDIMSQKGITGRALAEYMDVHHVTVSRWLHGFSEPCIKELIEIANFLDVTLDELVGR